MNLASLRLASYYNCSVREIIKISLSVSDSAHEVRHGSIKSIGSMLGLSRGSYETWGRRANMALAFIFMTEETIRVSGLLDP